MVLVHETNVPPQMWCLRRVTETKAGTDGCVKVVRLKTAAGHLMLSRCHLFLSVFSESPSVMTAVGTLYV